MTDLYVWLAVLALALATYFAALKLALLRMSRPTVQQVLTERGKPDGGAWLASRLDATSSVASLLRTAMRLLFFILVLAEVLGLPSAEPLTWPHLLISAVIAIPLLWVCSSVLAAALARHAGHGLVASGLPLLRALTFVAYPLVKAVSFIDEAVRRLSGADLDQSEIEAELLRSIDQTQREGRLDSEAASMLENVVEFTNTDVAAIMTPRTDIEGIELTNDLAEIRSFIAQVGHSRIPVFKENLDHVVGILYVRDLVRYLGEDANNFKLEPLLRQPIIVPETKPVRELLSDFQRSEVHMAIVIDEYGGTEGLVTIEDVLEEIVGEIRDEHEPEGEGEPALTSLDERRSVVDGRFHIDDLNEQLGLTLPENDDFDTVGGFVLATLGHVPREGETFESHNARFTAVEAAPTHVQRIEIELLGAETDGK